MVTSLSGPAFSSEVSQLGFGLADLLSLRVNVLFDLSNFPLSTFNITF